MVVKATASDVVKNNIDKGLAMSSEENLAENIEQESEPQAEVVEPEVVENNEVHISEQESAKLRNEVLQLRAAAEDVNFKLAEKLHQVYSMRAFLDWNYSTWEEYVTNGEELNFTVRKANYLRQIWEWFAVTVNDDKLLEEVKNIGWTRAMMLTGILNTDNADKWLPIAKNPKISCKELDERIKEYKKSLQDGKKQDDDGEVDVKHKLNVSLYNEQFSVVSQAMERAGEIGNTSAKGNQIALICQDYLATANWSKDPRANLVAYLAKFEKLLGLTIVAVNQESQDVLYGQSFLASLQEDNDDEVDVDAANA